MDKIGLISNKRMLLCSPWENKYELESLLTCLEEFKASDLIVYIKCIIPEITSGSFEVPEKILWIGNLRKIIFSATAIVNSNDGRQMKASRLF